MFWENKSHVKYQADLKELWTAFRDATLLKRLQHMQFPVNTAKFLRTAFFKRFPLAAY